MGEYQIAPVLSLTTLPESPCHYGKPSEAKKPLVHTPQTKYDGTFVLATIPLEEESEDRAIAAWLYKDETLVDLTEQARRITPEKYGPGLKLMKRYGYKGTGPIGYNNNGLIDLITATTRSNKDRTGLGYNKTPFHLGINKFVSKLGCSIEPEVQIDSDVFEDSDDGEDPYPHPIPHDLAKFFAELDDFVP